MLSLLSCLAYIVCVSVQYNSVLMTQALLTVIFVFYVSLGFMHTLLTKGARCVAPFQILFSNCVCKARLVVGDDGAMIRKLMDRVEFLVVDDDDMRWHWVHI